MIYKLLLPTILFFGSLSLNAQPVADCDNAEAFCGSAALSFPNSTSTTAPAGVDYGTLCSVPNPTWYYMQVDQPGKISMHLDGGNLDLDFTMWGPFNDPHAGCASIMSGQVPIQSSYDGSHTETVAIGSQGGGGGCAGVGVSTPPAAQAGDYYIVLVTNYSNSSGSLSFNQTNIGQAGAGSTNCAIVEPCDVASITATATCNGGNAVITGVVTAGTGMTTGALVVSSSCGTDTQSFAVNTTNFPPSNYGTLNYSITTSAATGQSCTITAKFTDNQLCDSSITINLPDCSVVPCPTISLNNATLCLGDNITLTTTGTTGTWSTSDANIASVNNGLVTAVANGTATIKYTQDTCVAQSIITVSDPVTPTFVNPGPICDGGTYTLSNTSNQGILGTWSPAIDATQTTTYTFTPNADQCGVPTTMQVAVDSSVAPTFTLSSQSCLGQNVTLPVTSNNGINGTWNPPFNNAATTTYTFTPDPGVCSEPYSIQIEIVSDIVPTFNLPSIICENEKIKLPTTSSNGINGTWTPSTLTYKDSVYTFVVTDSNSCANNLTVTIPFIPMPSTTEVTAVPTLVHEGDQTKLTADIDPYIQGILFSWDPSSTLNCDDCPNPIASPTEATWYVVTMTAPDGCKYRDSIFIDYRMNCGENFVPNIFTPNDDGENDIFKPYGRCLEKGEIFIYNRWGEKIFYSNEIQKGWDGTHKGKLVNGGVYTYIINVTTIYGENYNLKGTVTLVK